MHSERLLDLAFRFRDSRLWEKLDTYDIFAVLLPDEETGYCVLHEISPDSAELGLYVGSPGYTCLRRLAEKPYYMEEDPEELLVSLNCLICKLVAREQMLIEELMELQDYTRKKTEPWAINFCPGFSSRGPVGRNGPFPGADWRRRDCVPHCLPPLCWEKCCRSGPRRRSACEANGGQTAFS